MTALFGDAPVVSGIASALVPMLSGWPISGLLPRRLRASLACRLAMAWLLGAAWCGTIALAASRLGGLPLRRTTLLPIVLLPVLVAAATRPGTLVPGRPRRASLPGIAAGLVVGAAGAALMAGALFAPVRDWDGRMTWMPQARMIRLERTATPSALTDPWVWVSHPQYPPLVALVQVAGLEIVSAPDDERAGRGVHPLFFVSLLVVLYRCVRVVTGTGLAAAAASSIAAMTPFLAFESHGGAAGAYADAPLAALLGAGLALLLCGRAGLRTGALAGLLLAGAVLTKNEGLPLVLGLLVVLLGISLAGPGGGARRTRARSALVTAVPLVSLVACAALLLGAFRAPIPNRYDEDYASILSGGDFAPRVLAGKAVAVAPLLARKLGDVRAWGLLWPLLGVLAALRPRALLTKAALAAGALLAAPVALGLAAYLVHWDPLGLAETTFDRFLVQGSFGTFLLLGLLLAAARRPASRTLRPSGERRAFWRV